MKILFLYQVHKHPEIKNLIQTLQKKGSQTSRDKKTLIQYLQKVHEHPEIKTSIQNLHKKGLQTSRDKSLILYSSEFSKFTNINYIFA